MIRKIVTVLAMAVTCIGIGAVSAHAASPESRVASPVKVSPSERATIVRELWRDMPESRPPAQCFDIWTSSHDRRWIMIDESKYAIDHGRYCPLSDAWSYGHRTSAGWSFMDYSGSSREGCAARVGYLGREGMPRAVAEDLNRVFGCTY